MNWKSISEIIVDPISGEWGEEGDRIKVLRTTNFSNEGRLNLKEVVKRNVDAKKIEKKKTKGWGLDNRKIRGESFSAGWPGCLFRC